MQRPETRDFVRQIVAQDVARGAFDGRVVTRFPPEPNGYLHIGHAKALHLNFSIAREFGGRCHLRMDDTNPVTEEVEFIEAIKRDVKWLGYDWGEHFYHASDYFEQMYCFAEALITKGKAYVCQLPPEVWKEYRGVPEKPGKESPFRNRPPAESLDLFRRMRAGQFPDGAMVLRAKIDMSSPNLHLRDPVLYRILHAEHPHAGKKWCIYPTYDFAHCLEDSIEGITHSFCTLEFEVHRPLYDWILDQLGIHHPKQIEFARLNLSYTVMSKRQLTRLVEEGKVKSWDDPRLPTIAGLRRRGVPPEAIRSFCDLIGVTKVNGLTDIALLEHAIRDHLNRRAPRAMAVINPLRLVIENYPEADEESFQAVNNPEDPSAGTRPVPFSRELFIERDDFRIEPPPKYHRLAPGREVRLRYACLVTCTGFERDPDRGEITTVYCRYDPRSRGGSAPDGRKVKGTIHWVSARHAVPAVFNLYERLFTVADPADRAKHEGRDITDFLNPQSLRVVRGVVEPSLGAPPPLSRWQFERLGYFCADPETRPGAPVFNRTVTLRDSWSRRERKLSADPGPLAAGISPW